MCKVYQYQNWQKNLTLLLIISMFACEAWTALDLTLLFDDADGLQVKSPLVMKSITIGEVTEIGLNEQQKVAVKVRIKSDYKKLITVGTDFVLSHEGGLGTGNSYIEVIAPEEPGEQLASNTVINGTTKTAYRLQQVGKVVNTSINKMTEITERIAKGLNAYRESPEGKDLQKSLEELIDKSEQMGDEAYKLYREEIKPTLKKKIDAFEDYMERTGKKKQLEKLKEDLEKLLE